MDIIKKEKVLGKRPISEVNNAEEQEQQPPEIPIITEERNPECIPVIPAIPIPPNPYDKMVKIVIEELYTSLVECKGNDEQMRTLCSSILSFLNDRKFVDALFDSPDININDYFVYFIKGTRFYLSSQKHAVSILDRSALRFPNKETNKDEYNTIKSIIAKTGFNSVTDANKYYDVTLSVNFLNCTNKIVITCDTKTKRIEGAKTLHIVGDSDNALTRIIQILSEKWNWYAQTYFKSELPVV
jgi:hypothetical protein